MSNFDDMRPFCKPGFELCFKSDPPTNWDYYYGPEWYAIFSDMRDSVYYFKDSSLNACMFTAVLAIRDKMGIVVWKAKE